MRILFLLALSLVSCSGCKKQPILVQACEPAAMDPAFVAMVEQTLHVEYHDLNWAYFDGQLPHDTVIAVDWMAEANEDISFTHVHADGDHFHYYIGFNPNYIKAHDLMKEALIHEMCHVDLYEQGINREQDAVKAHNGAWQSCMLRLANAGALKDNW